MTTVGTHALAACEPEAYAFADDGLVPNIVLPLLVYRAAMRVGVARPEEVIEERFAENGWGAMWRNGVYDYLHYHATVHEALAVARGRARVQFGGERQAMSPSCLPAGTGHQSVWSSKDFVVIGAYPPGPPMEVALPTPANRTAALKSIPAVALPSTDPLFGAEGPLRRIWRALRPPPATA